MDYPTGRHKPRTVRILKPIQLWLPGALLTFDQFRGLVRAITQQVRLCIPRELINHLVATRRNPIERGIRESGHRHG